MHTRARAQANNLDKKGEALIRKLKNKYGVGFGGDSDRIRINWARIAEDIDGCAARLSTSRQSHSRPMRAIRPCPSVARASNSGDVSICISCIGVQLDRCIHIQDCRISTGVSACS